ncbi:MAG: arginine--tRNA ligase [Candidatus Paceibacterota bacterium]|jgi:arginyl-tRNA synthetase
MTENIREKLAREVLDIVRRIFPRFDGEVNVALTHPESFEHGDYTTNVALQLSKELGKKPKDIGEQIAAELEKHALVAKAEVAGPGFVNIFLKPEFFAGSLKTILDEKEAYGKSDWGKGKTWLIEHTSANPTKALHLGHLRNNITGMAVSNLWQAMGINVVRDYVLNDRGIAIMKLVWGYLKFGRNDKDETKATVAGWAENKSEWLTPESVGIKPDRFVEQYYTLGTDDFKNLETEALVRELTLAWDADGPYVRELTSLLVGWVLDGQMATMKRLGSSVDIFWKESEHYAEGKKYIEEGLAKSVFTKLEDGAVLSKLESYKIPDTILMKRDGTSLYITQDIALTKLKKEKTRADKMFWVVGPEQSLALRQVFAICEQLGIGKISDFTHLPYGLVSIKGSGKMSSRTGNIVYVDDLIELTKKELKARIPAEKFMFENEDEALEIIALGAIKYSILRTGRTTDTTFDFDTSLSFEGDSGPYLQYVYARIQSLLRKAESAGISGKVSPYPVGEGETLPGSSLARLIARYPEIIERAGLDYAPNHLASYLLQLAQEFNSFYGSTQIVSADDAESPHRVAIAAATAQVIRNGLKLLGIETLEKM